jgi:hypothetical protein
MVIWMEAFRSTDSVNDQIEAWESFTGLPEVMHILKFGLGTNRTGGYGEGVTAVFYRASACSGERLWPNFNWSVLRAIRDYKRARTGSNWGNY